MSELKPCPFCGKDVFLLDVAIQPSADAKWDVYCRTHECFLNSGTNNMFSNHEEAILAWNTRADSTELAAIHEQVKLLREALELVIASLTGMMNYYGTGLQVANWHLNGDTEPFDSFIDEEGCGNALDALSAALAQTKPKDGGE